MEDKMKEYLNGSNKFIPIDVALEELAKADSSVEYASHLRKPFDRVVEGLNLIKKECGYEALINQPEYYFNAED